MPTSEQYFANFLLLPGVGPSTLYKIMKYFRDGKSAWESSSQELFSSGAPQKIISELIEARNKINPENIGCILDRENIQIISIFNPNYPDLLKEIHHLPPLLFIKGNAELFKSQTKCVAIVGTRKASIYGKHYAKHFAELLAAKNFCIVSGLALGIDTEAHKGALNSKGATFAVLGTSLEEKNIYPAMNKKLASEIGESGLLISEFPPTWEVLPSNFPRRNRIIAGLCQTTIVIEGAIDSGSLITARYALDQNRDILALPGDINKENSKGVNSLIKQGAGIITCDDDLLEYFNLTENKTATPNNLSANENKIIEALKNEAKTFDELQYETKFDFTTLTQILMAMELKDLVKNQGGRYIII